LAGIRSSSSSAGLCGNARLNLFALPHDLVAHTLDFIWDMANADKTIVRQDG
jgi:hypothetical protein